MPIYRSMHKENLGTAMELELKLSNLAGVYFLKGFEKIKRKSTILSDAQIRSDV